MKGDFLGVLILCGGPGFASGQPQQVETNLGAPASFSLSPLAPSALAQRLPKRDCESTITTSLLPFINWLCCKHTSATVQLVVNRAFLDYFVVDVAIILFNRKGFMIFTWRNLFLSTIIIFYRYFCLLIFFYAYIFCTASAFLKTAEHTTMCSML